MVLGAARFFQQTWSLTLHHHLVRRLEARRLPVARSRSMLVTGKIATKALTSPVPSNDTSEAILERNRSTVHGLAVLKALVSVAI